MKKSLKLIQAGFQSSSETTEEFKKFFKVFIEEMTVILKEFWAEKIEFTRGHFYVSGFFDIGDNVYYFSISDVRYFPGEDLLVRIARDHKDYSGWRNEYCRLDNLEEDLRYIIT